ncbi:5-oxoprolinase-like [Zophobas morio]|uniref:5-oxoprolinase-like n=1 Tax=Zophobas morio TaxID=2755281 RepID=UPI0030835127
MGNKKFSFAIDRGGTFTDVYSDTPSGPKVIKLLSEDPSNYSDPAREGIRRILEEVTGKSFPKAKPVETQLIESIRLGTTVATNALLERKGSDVALLTTKGFADLLVIGTQARPKIFDLKIEKLEVLYKRVVEIDESCLAVVFMHSYLNDKHEKKVARLAEEVGFRHISLSSQVMPMIKIVSRGYTTCADAYLTPVITEYVHSFQQGFDNGITKVSISFMQSDGGLASVQDFNGFRAILSGPAGGVVGYSKTTYRRLTNSPLIGFDMGGTSTDVSRFSGKLEHVFETETAGITIQAPQLDVHTIAAGGGSRLYFQEGIFIVGPESVGANPGPVCYRKGGHLAITDANLLLGRIYPDNFPKIFGPDENEGLDLEATRRAFKELTKEINAYKKKHSPNYVDMTCEEVAYGFLEVANEAMCRSIRSLTQSKGFDTSSHALCSFGGAGGQHAVAIAKSLGMKEIYINKYSGILSAYGIALADVIVENQRPCSKIYDPEDEEVVKNIKYNFFELSEKTTKALEEQGFAKSYIKIRKLLNMRYDKTDCSLMIEGDEFNDFGYYFLQNYEREFGFTIPARDIIIDDIHVRGIGTGSTLEEVCEPGDQTTEKDLRPVVEPIATTRCYFKGGFKETPVYATKFDLFPSEAVVYSGPCIIMDSTSTVLVEPGCSATYKQKSLFIRVGGKEDKKVNNIDPVLLAILSHRFMSVAEQMGCTLQRTSISTNIKERLDFSCALFGPDGGLVANAPHIPVHLGAMQEAVKYQITLLKGFLQPGDVIISNHPEAGGSHLPDITCITPVFYEESSAPVFFVAARGHHADVGGITPGSMPPTSRFLEQVNNLCYLLSLVSFLFRLLGGTSLLLLFMPPGDNISDLKAQIAANHHGIRLVNELIEQYGIKVVQAYMHHIQENASDRVRKSLQEIFERSIFRGKEKVVLYAEDRMDDGSPICVHLTIFKDGSASFDFTNTGHQVLGNWNMPKAVTLSAVIYCLRCLIPYEIPLNQGCLTPVRFVIPPNSIIDPGPDVAVVGGNVLTSQRVADVILKVLGACADSQGCMNNLTFGDNQYGYYETIAGGAGAGPSWHGTAGVHTHMTNTRITDPEVLENRYPVILRQFSLRKGSGGLGKFKGGDGVIREIEFRKKQTVSILSERRSFAPSGMNGGCPGSRGLNILEKYNRKPVNVGGRATFEVHSRDRLVIHTPGGGGYGLHDG